MLKVYVRDMAPEWGYDYKPFKPTGRWKTQIIDDEVTIYLEHQGLIFKKWYDENDVIMQEERIFVNECVNEP